MSKQTSYDMKKSGLIRHDEKRIVISESSLLVPLTQSKKLAAIRKQSQSSQSMEKNPVQNDGIVFSESTKEINGLLTEAREQIDVKIREIMASYPPDKKNKMFALRYGSPESIKQMNMKAIFTRLNIVKPKKFALIEGLDYFGNLSSRKTRA